MSEVQVGEESHQRGDVDLASKGGPSDEDHAGDHPDDCRDLDGPPVVEKEAQEVAKGVAAVQRFDRQQVEESPEDIDVQQHQQERVFCPERYTTAETPRLAVGPAR